MILSRLNSIRCAVTLLLAAGLAGCGHTGQADQPPDYMVVEGRAQADPSDFAGGEAGAAGLPATLRAETRVPIDLSIGEPSRRAMMAGAAARRQALRNLGRAIGEILDAGEQPLAQRIAADAQLASDLTQLLREQATVEVKPGPQEALAAATIGGGEVAALFQKYGATFKVKLEDLPSERQEAFRRAVYDGALADARKRLREQVIALPAQSGGTLGEIFEKHPDRARQLDEQIALIQADDTRYLPDGMGIVEIYYDVNRARTLAAGGGAAWQFWK